MFRQYHLSIVILSLIILVIAITPAKAQSLWQDYTARKTLTLEILKPEYDDGNQTFLTSAIFCSARAPITRNIVFVGELPFSYINWDIPPGPDLGSQQTFGNPYFGFEIDLHQVPLSFELGVRAPVTADPDKENGEATINGYLTDFIDRAEAFAPNAVPISGFVNFVVESYTGFSLRLRAGPAIWIATGDRDESETFILYSAQAWWDFGSIRIGGRYIASEDYVDFGERSSHQLGFGFNLSLGAFTPGIQVRIPLDKEYKDILDIVFGISLGIDFD
jgi:hypothetical protein